jgi:hypothetical protein
MDFSDIALVALVGGGIYFYVNLPVEAFTDTDKYPVITNPDGTKDQTRFKDGSTGGIALFKERTMVHMLVNGKFMVSEYPKPKEVDAGGGDVAKGAITSGVKITYYDADGKPISMEKFTEDILSSNPLTPPQSGGGFVPGANKTSDSINTNVNPNDFSQLPTPPPQIPNPSWPGSPGFPGQGGFPYLPFPR